MYTKQDLIQCLKDMGLKSTDAIMVHSSMKAIGEVEGGADTVVDAFMEYFEVDKIDAQAEAIKNVLYNNERRFFR